MNVRVWVLSLGVLAPALCQVRTWQDNQILPTYEEGLPDPSPPFYIFKPSEASVYPYTMRTSFTKKRGEHAWRALHLENEYLSCMVLPDLGGHLYSCKDKLSGQEMFHLNPSVKKAHIGLRGAWVAMGLEMNFPVGHSWVTVSPVDFATTQNADGSASIWVGNIDRVDGMQWRVEFVLRPGVAMLQQNVFLYNRSSVRHRYYWWNNAGIARVDNKTRFILPTQAVGSPSRTEIETWPVNSAGVDISVIGNYKATGVALFTQDCREPFMAVYHPTLRSGTVHYADATDVPGKKLWTWGREGDKTAAVDLSDDNTSYIELQAGVMENQETFALLEPGEYKKFSEYWMPVRGLGGVSRANREGVLYIGRSPEKSGQTQLIVEFDANRKVAGGKIVVTDGKSAVLEEAVNLDPANTFLKTLRGLPSQSKYTVQVLDNAGQMLLSHTEGQFDTTPAKDMKIGPQTTRDWSERSAHSAADFLDIGTYHESQGMPGLARHAYQTGLTTYPRDPALNRAVGRLAVSESRFEEAETALAKALAVAPDDSESHYYQGLTSFRQGNYEQAEQEYGRVNPRHPLYPAALLGRATLLGRSGDNEASLKLLETVLAKQPDSIEAGAMTVTLLRRAGQKEKARSELARLQLLDATDTRLRYERVLLGEDNPLLWAHFAGDPDRVLNVASAYMDLGLFDDALTLLSHQFPAPADTMAAEPGAVLPQHHPLVVYYRAYCLLQLKKPARKDFDEASGYLTEYIFPNRPLTYDVLSAALSQNAADGTALFLLGELYLNSELTDQAINAWQQSLRAGFKKAEIFRLLGRALLDLKQDKQGALAVYQQGLKIAPNDPTLQKAVQELFGSEPKAPSVSVGSSVKTPAPPAAPTHAAIVALGLAADGQFKEAIASFNPATFPDEKQDNFVREAYIEIFVEEAVALAKAKRCTDAFDAEQNLGNEDLNLPFTFRGFGQFLKGTRMQFELAQMEAMCGNNGAAKKIWAKLAKSPKDLADPEFAFPLLASSRIASEAETKPRIEAALEQIKIALAGSSTNPAALLYSRGMLLRAIKKEPEAKAAFADAIGANPPPMLAHLAIRALRSK